MTRSREKNARKNTSTPSLSPPLGLEIDDLKCHQNFDFLCGQPQIPFLDAPSHLYMRSCPSVGPSVGPALFSKVKSTHTRRILCRVSGFVSLYPVLNLFPAGNTTRKEDSEKHYSIYYHPVLRKQLAILSVS